MHAATLRNWAIVALVLVSSALPAHAPFQLPGNKTLEKVDFERHVMGLLGRMGCNAGSCHGSFQGKGGFRLSLFGYEPAKDYADLTRDNLGRRVNLVQPRQQPAAAQGDRPDRARRRHALRQGLVGSTSSSASGSPSGAQVERRQRRGQATSKSRPPRLRLRQGRRDRPARGRGDASPTARRKTSRRSATSAVNDDAVAEVAVWAASRPCQPGDTVDRRLLPRQRRRRCGCWCRPRPARASSTRRSPEVNYIDREVFAKLKLLNMVPSRPVQRQRVPPPRLPSTRSARCRRRTRCARSSPTRTPNKREKKIDELLAHPLHAALWATKFSRHHRQQHRRAGAAAAAAGRSGSQMWHDWFRKRIADNMPYDQIVKRHADRDQPRRQAPDEWIAHVKKIDEASSTKGFDDRLRRAARRSTCSGGGSSSSADRAVGRDRSRPRSSACGSNAPSATSTRSTAGRRPTTGRSPTSSRRCRLRRLAGGEEGGRRRERQPAGSSASRSRTGSQCRVQGGLRRHAPASRLTHPDDRTPRCQPRRSAGPEITLEPGEDPRESAVRLAAQPDNPFFAQSFVNRVWAHYFGVGLVNPVDDFSLANPPTNARLLDALAKDFVEQRVRHPHIWNGRSC